VTADIAVVLQTDSPYHNARI